MDGRDQRMDGKLPERDSVFYELTRSICPECTQVIDAQIHLRDGQV